MYYRHKETSNVFIEEDRLKMLPKNKIHRQLIRINRNAVHIFKCVKVEKAHETHYDGKLILCLLFERMKKKKNERTNTYIY